MQGQTIKRGSKAVVNWSKRMPPSLAYVMLSRSEAVEDLIIGGNFDLGKIRCDPKALEEAKRLDEISLPLVRDRPDESFGFAFINIRSLNKNFEHLEIDQTMLLQDIIFVTETWKDPNSHKVFNLKGYHSAFAHGYTVKGKGVAVFFKKVQKLRHVKRTIFSLSSSKGKIL